MESRRAVRHLGGQPALPTLLRTLCIAAAVPLLGGCSGSDEQPCTHPTGFCDWGEIRVTATTTGMDLDADGYDVLVDGSYRWTIPANGTETVQARAGSHSVSLDDVAENCEIQGAQSQGVNVISGSTSMAQFDVLCADATPRIPVLSVSGSALTFSADESENPDPQTIVFANGGNAPLTWSASDDAAWLSVAPTSGTLADGEDVSVTVSVSSAGLAPGDHTATITVSATGATGSPQTISVTHTVTPVGPHLLTLTGTGGGSGTVTSDPAGIDCLVTAGTSSGTCEASFDDGTSVTLSALPASGSVLEEWSGACSGADTCTVPMTAAQSVGVEFALMPGQFELTPTELGFETTEGTDPADGSVTVRNVGGTALDWSATDDADWMSLSPTTGSLDPGAEATLTTSISSASLAVGSYEGAITVTGEGETQSVSVTLTVSPTPQHDLTVTGAGDGSGAVTSDPAGIDCQVTAGATSGACASPFDEGTDVTLSATPAGGSMFVVWSGACSGADTCTIPMTEPQSVGAEFALQPGRLELSPTSMSFHAPVGQSAPAQTLTIRNVGGSPLTWAIEHEGDTEWLTLGSDTGTLAEGAETMLSVGTNDTRPAGTYEGALLVQSAEADNSPQEVDVSFAVTSGDGTLAVTTLTTGRAEDRDGYDVLIDGSGGHPIGLSETLEIPLAGGSYTIGLGEMVTNCSIVGDAEREVVIGKEPVTTVEFEVACPCTVESPYDADSDRLPDCAETNTGQFVSQVETGTDPFHPDTDGDDLPDGDEVLGTLEGLDLPALGVSPVRKDVLIEYDWFDDALVCAPHSHRPTDVSIAVMTASFATAPVPNPDGSYGVNIINDYGQGGVFTGGNYIADDDGILADGLGFTSEFQAHKGANFDPNRAGYFHYVILPHRYNTDSNSSGLAEVWGDDFIVSLICWNSDLVEANTIMHELGHNLGLLHGGSVNINYKPNYNSVMNYKYQFPGVDADCTPSGNGVTDYSYGDRPPLDENNLDETQGICGNPPGPGWDWNGNGIATDVGVVADINHTDGMFTVLEDSDDWSILYFAGLRRPGMGIESTPQTITCQDLPPGAR